MLLALHISAAIAGILTSTYSAIFPSAYKIRLAGGLVILTLLSGTVIIIEKHLGLVSACVSGLIYVGFTAVSLMIASRRLTD